MPTGFDEIDNVINESKTLLEKSTAEQNKIVDLGMQKATNAANKQKQEITEEAEKQGKQLYTDYRKQSSAYGVNAENLASQGLNNSGMAETSKVNMYNTYQKNVTTLAVETRKLKANVDFELHNAMIEADVQKAENVANNYLQQMQLLMTEYDMRFNREQFEYQKQRDAVSDMQQEREYQLALSNSKKGSGSGPSNLVLEAEPNEMSQNAQQIFNGYTQQNIKNTKDEKVKDSAREKIFYDYEWGRISNEEADYLMNYFNL